MAEGDDVAKLDTRLKYVEGALHSTQILASLTAKGVGRDRNQRQVVLFLTGTFREKVADSWRVWREGAAASREAGDAGRDRPKAWKCQLFDMVVGQLGVQGVSEGLRQQLHALPISAVEACFHKEPPVESDKPWVCSLLFRQSAEGLQGRSLLVRGAVRKGSSGYPELGIRPSAFYPGPAHREVLEDLGHDESDIRAYFRGGKGKGKGGKGVGAESSDGLGGGGKRRADRRLSVVAERAHKR